MLWFGIDGQGSGFLLCIFGLVRRAVFEPEAVVSSLEYVAVVGQAVEKRRRHLRIAKHARPLAEAEVCGDDDACLFI
jgi:hypothetical protein